MNSMPVCKNSYNDLKFLKEGEFIEVAPGQKLH